MLPHCHQNAWQNYHTKIANRLFENVAVQIFWNNSKKSTSDSGGSQEETQLGFCFLQFSQESFVFSSAV
jgi:hypothetical protein